MARIDIKSAGATLSDGVLQLENGVAMDATLRNVADQNNTTSPLKLSTTAVQVVSPFRITTDDPSDMYLDCEDGSANNRFNITRNTASQQVNLNFASNPVGSTSIVGGIRTFVNGVNLSEVMAFREDGQTFVTGNTTIGNGTTAIASRLAVKGSGSTSATTSLLVQNSAGTETLSVNDAGNLYVRSSIVFLNNPNFNIITSNFGGVTFDNDGIGSVRCSFTNGRFSTNNSVGFGATNTYASAQVSIDSTTRGFLPPRMTNAQRAAITTPAIGLMVYCTDAVEGIYVYKSTGWTFVA